MSKPAIITQMNAPLLSDNAEIRKQVDAIFKRPQDHKLVGTPLPGVGRAKRLAEDRQRYQVHKAIAGPNKSGPYIIIGEASEMFQAMSDEENTFDVE